MSIFGQSTASTPALTGVQLQTSSNALPVPIIYGINTLAPNIIWVGNFRSTSESTGKGGLFGSGTQYDYKTALVLGICEGPITQIGTVYNSQATYTPAQQNLSLINGASPQAPWSFLTASYPTQALSYGGTALAVSSNFDLGSSGSIGSLSFEIYGLLYTSAVVNAHDADPALVIGDFLTNPQYGVGFPAASISTATLYGVSGDSSYQTYCQAIGLAISPCLTDQESARSILDRWLQLTNSTAVWSGPLLKIIPFGDAPATGTLTNGTTVNFQPNTTPVYDLTDDDFIYQDGEDPVVITRTDPYSASNVQRIEILNRAPTYTSGAPTGTAPNYYAPTPIEARDQNAIELYGLKVASTLTAHEICDINVGSISAQLILQRGLYVRNTYALRLSWEYCLLEPMDLVTLTDSGLGLYKKAVRIIDIEEDDQGLLSITAEEWSGTASHTAVYTAEGGAGPSFDRGVTPGPINRPVIFEAPATLTGATNELWVGASGASAYWGGCYVYLSYENTTYSMVATISGPARIGTLTEPLPVGTSTDTVNTLAVDISESIGAQLISGTLADATNLATLCYVDGELLAFETAALTGNGQYSLTHLVRGAYGTPILNHGVGVLFARLDSQIVKVPFNKAQVGADIFLKFVSYNIWGQATQSLSDVTPITYTFNGGQAPGIITITSATMVQSGLGMALVAAWAADALSDTYQAQLSLDNGSTWANTSEGSQTGLRRDGLKAIPVLLRVRGISATAVLGPWTNDTITPPTFVGSNSGYGAYVNYYDINTSLIDSALNSAIDADQAEIAGVITSVNAFIGSTTALRAANSAQATSLSLLAGQIPSIAASISLQTNGLLGQITANNQAILAQAQQEANDVIALGGRITTQGTQLASTTALVTQLSVASGSTVLQEENIASQSNQDGDGGELAQVLAAVNTGLAANIAKRQSNAAFAAIANIAYTNTTLTTATALAQTTLAASVGTSLSVINTTLTSQAATNTSTASSISTLTSQINNSTSGLSATYNIASSVKTLTSDASHGNIALGNALTSLTTTVGNNSSSIITLGTAQTTAANTFALYQTTVESTYATQTALTSGLSTTSANASNALAAYETTVGATYATQSALTSGLSSTAASAASALASYQMTVEATYATQSALTSGLSTTATNAASALAAYETTVSSTYATQTALTSGLSTAATNASNALAAYETTVSSTYATQTALSSGISTAETNASNALAAYETTVSSTYATKTALGTTNTNVSTATTNISNLTTAQAALSTDVINVTATANNVSANGQVNFSAQSAPSGVSARFGVTLSATGYGAASGGFSLDLVSGQVLFTVAANVFRVENSSTRQVPFAIASDNTIQLNSVTRINGTIQSATNTPNTGATPNVPIMLIDGVTGTISFFDGS